MSRYLLVILVLLSYACGGSSNENSADFHVTGTITGLSGSDALFISVNGSATTRFGNGAFKMPVTGSDFELVINTSSDNIRCVPSRSIGTESQANGILITCRYLLQLVSSSVEHGDTEVPRSSPISLKFDMAIDPESLSNISLRETSSGREIPMVVDLNENDDTVVEFRQWQFGDAERVIFHGPTVGLFRNSEHLIEINGGLKALEGRELEDDIQIRFRTENKRAWRTDFERGGDQFKIIGSLKGASPERVLAFSNYGLEAIPYIAPERRWSREDSVILFSAAELGIADSEDAWFFSSDKILAAKLLNDSDVLVVTRTDTLPWKVVNLESGETLESGDFLDHIDPFILARNIDVSTSPDRSRAVVSLNILTEAGLTCRPEYIEKDYTICSRNDFWMFEWNSASGMDNGSRFQEGHVLYSGGRVLASIANDGSILRAAQLPEPTAEGNYWQKTYIDYRSTADGNWVEHPFSMMYRSSPTLRTSSTLSNRTGIYSIEIPEIGNNVFVSDQLIDGQISRQELGGTARFLSIAQKHEYQTDAIVAANGYELLVQVDYSSEIRLFTRNEQSEWQEQGQAFDDSYSFGSFKALSGTNPISNEKEWIIFINYAIDGQSKTPGLLIAEAGETPVFELETGLKGFPPRLYYDAIRTSDGGYHIVFGAHDAPEYYENEISLGWLVFD